MHLYNANECFIIRTHNMMSVNELVFTENVGYNILIFLNRQNLILVKNKIKMKLRHIITQLLELFCFERGDKACGV